MVSPELLRQLPLGPVEYGQVVEAWAVSGWSGPSTRSRISSAAIKRLGLRQLPLGLVEYGQVVEACGGVGVVRTQHTLPNLQRAAIKRLGLRQLPLGMVE